LLDDDDWHGEQRRDRYGDFKSTFGVRGLQVEFVSHDTTQCLSASVTSPCGPSRPGPMGEPGITIRPRTTPHGGARSGEGAIWLGCRPVLQCPAVGVALLSGALAEIR